VIGIVLPKGQANEAIRFSIRYQSLPRSWVKTLEMSDRESFMELLKSLSNQVLYVAIFSNRYIYLPDYLYKAVELLEKNYDIVQPRHYIVADGFYTAKIETEPNNIHLTVMNVYKYMEILQGKPMNTSTIIRYDGVQAILCNENAKVSDVIKRAKVLFERAS
jgi:hypothetical protein